MPSAPRTSSGCGELTDLRRQGGVIDGLLADHGLFHLEADLRWIDVTAARLSSLAEEVRSREHPSRSSRWECLIEARGLVKSFGPTPALRGADLSVRAGEIVAVMGPSGSGKSTLLHCLAGILVPEEGEVWFSGQRVDAMRETTRSALRRDRFGFVFQSGQLVPELTAEENVALPLLLRGVRRSEALERDSRMVRTARPVRARAAPFG